MKRTKKEATYAISKLKEFIGPAQMHCLVTNCRGEEKQFFFNKLCELEALIGSMPKTYQTDGQGEDSKVFLHYFTSGCDWYIREKDKGTPDEPGQHQAFGWADLGHGPELGYISIVELLACGAELDLYFTPKSWSELQNRKVGGGEVVEKFAPILVSSLTPPIIAPPVYLPPWRRATGA